MAGHRDTKSEHTSVVVVEVEVVVIVVVVVEVVVVVAATAEAEGLCPKLSSAQSAQASYTLEIQEYVS